VTPANSHGGAAVVGHCSLWNSNATHLASLEPSTSQIIMQSQHACTGREDFKLHLYSNNEIMLTQHREINSSTGPTTTTTPCINMINKEETVESALVCRWPSVKCIRGEKPTKIVLELASSPCFVITAHGHLLGFLPSSSSLDSTGTLMSTSLSSNGKIASPFGQANTQGWQFEHHGDSTYTIRNIASKKLLYVTEAGALKIDGNEPLFPDSRILFNVELAWTKIENRGAGHETLFEDSEHREGEETPAAAARPSGQHLDGFTIKTVFKLEGKQLCLTALPDGRIGTCYRKSQPSRWELFALADREAVVKSSAQPLLRLPAFREEDAAKQQQQSSTSIRRTSSCQAIMKNIPVSGSSMLSTSPSTLPGILEQAAFKDESDADDGSGDEMNQQLRGSLNRGTPSMRGRRCASESALSHLQGNNNNNTTKEPTWLADLRKTPVQASGWDVRSAASMQEQSCHSLCAAALSDSCCDFDTPLCSRPDSMHSNHLIAYAESLPDEIKDQFVEKLTLLTAAPAAAKLSFQHLSKAAVQGNAPEWSKELVLEDFDVEMLPEEVAEVCRDY
jgi:hypothetical protein